MHWYKHPAFKYPLTHRCGRTEAKGRKSLLRLLSQSAEKPFLTNLLMKAPGIGKVLKVQISRCGSLQVSLVLPSSLNMTLHFESALHPQELMYCHTEWGWTDHSIVPRRWLCKNSNRLHLVLRCEELRKGSDVSVWWLRCLVGSTQGCAVKPGASKSQLWNNQHWNSNWTLLWTAEMWCFLNLRRTGHPHEEEKQLCAAHPSKQTLSGLDSWANCLVARSLSIRIQVQKLLPKLLDLKMEGCSEAKLIYKGWGFKP